MSLPEDVKAVTVKYIPTTDLPNPVKIAVNHRCRLRMIITRGWNTQVDDSPPGTNGASTVAICDGGAESSSSSYVKYKFNLAFQEDTSSSAQHQMVVINMGAHGILFEYDMRVDFGSAFPTKGEVACTQFVTVVYS